MNENYRLSDIFLSVEEEERETWKIDNDNTADWALDKIKESREEYERFEKVAMAKIEQVKAALDQEKKKMENETGFFESKLREYIETVKTKDTKTQKTYSLPSGKLVIKKDKEDFKLDKEKVLENLKKLEGYEDYIKTKEDLAWGDLKKNLAIADGQIINKTTGEVLDIEGLGVEVKSGKFEIKF
ncbi:host-nuclease inhibitor Gam family protein [Tepidibacter hydrothermalis]|uniref:Host-nuclease inhibitor Gam family protein n=1 Tax=Tepidibacter hydrothermalis TaxID=3036126 RepID=A0ABY8E9Z7_9FIRM|nr:host-nuclease inhibitor Gam family protein [Tepidibacter hydrothermalis]WFD09758.1 host-nuclease inhibitor Gam family protein [Tepidibacter hydrothermalis]